MSLYWMACFCCYTTQSYLHIIEFTILPAVFASNVTYTTVSLYSTTALMNSRIYQESIWLKTIMLTFICQETS